MLSYLGYLFHDFFNIKNLKAVVKEADFYFCTLKFAIGIEILVYQNYVVIALYPVKIGYRILEDINIHECSSPLYKMS